MNWKLSLLAAPLLALTLTPAADAKDHWKRHSEHERRERIERQRQYRYRYNNGNGYNNGYGYNQYPNRYRALPPGLDRNRNGVDDRVERQQYRYNRNVTPYGYYRR